VTTVKGTKYTVTGTENGKIVVRQPSGKRRLLTVKDVGRARFDGAVAHYIAEKRVSA
jgi:hypothetical protein